MHRKFIIGVQGLTNEQEATFIQYLESQECIWWHWIDNFWMATTNNQDISTEVLADYLKSFADITLIIHEIHGDASWFSYGNDNSNRWLSSHWTKL